MASVIWNKISVSVHDSTSSETFEADFKMHLFNSVYMPLHWQFSIGTFDIFHWHTVPTREMRIVKLDLAA